MESEKSVSVSDLIEYGPGLSLRLLLLILKPVPLVLQDKVLALLLPMHDLDGLWSRSWVENLELHVHCIVKLLENVKFK